MLIFKLIILISVALSSINCSRALVPDPPLKEPEARVFPESFEKVWRAIAQAIKKYPVNINLIDSGLIETEYVKGDKLFSDPNVTRTLSGLRYKIIIRAVKGQMDAKSAVKVTVLKSAEIQPDFFSGYKPIASNGLEESAILYRITRNLEIDRLLQKATHSN